MTITKLKTKNQITLPNVIVKLLNLKRDELFWVDVEKNFIKLMPIKVEPRYAPDELKALEELFQKEKGRGKIFNNKKEFSAYLKKIAG